MKILQKAGLIVRGTALGLAVLACVNVAHAAPYASAITNIVLNGSNYVQFYLNEGATVVGSVTNGVTVTVVTYPSGTTNVLGTNVAAGSAQFPLGADTSFTINCTKVGAGAPVQTSTDTGFQGWSGVTLRAIEVNKNAQYGDSFGRVYVGVTGQTVANTQLPAARGYGIYGLTPDMRQNSFFGGTDPTPICTVYQTNTLTFTSVPTNGMVFVMNGITNTWTTNTITNVATQLPVTNTTAASAANLATLLTAANYPGTVQATAANNVVTIISFAQNISAATYYAFANPGNSGVFGPDFTLGNGGFGSGPYRMFVSDDGLVWATDATDGNANIFVFGRNFESTNKVWTVSGRLAGEAVGEHGNVNAVAVSGSLATGDLKIWTADNDMSVPAYLQNPNLGVLGNGGIGNFGSAQETVPGDANVLYGYNIGSGPFPCTNTPVFAATIGLDGGFPNGQVIGVGIGPNTNFIYASMRRFNYSDGGVQVFRRDTGARVYSSLSGTATAPNDVFAVAGVVPVPGSGSDAGVYSNPRISPDGRYIAILSGSQTPINRIVVASLTNGIPDESSIIIITNLPSTATPRELAWDIADNLYSASSGQAAIRSFSLGLTTTCITSNDITGANGSFQIILPPAAVSVAKGGDASQNYGTPITGTFAVNLTTNKLNSPITVNFSISGTATNGVNYTITTGNVGNGVTVATNSTGGGTITFPAATYPGVGNWTANISVVPTASPAVGPTLTVGVTLQGGTTYFATPPLAATVNILNTGKQFFFVSAAATGNTMSRAIPNDYAQFIINRWGDLNGPGNSVGSVNPTSITLTNFALTGTAAFPGDYTAGVQVYNGVAPQDGLYTITFNPGDTTKTVIVGNPVSHLNVLVAPTNATVIIGLTNSATGTNGTSKEGAAYTVNTATVTLTEFDNAVGTKSEVVLWSDALTNSMASNYTVVYASTNLATTTVLPVVIPNYTYTNGGAANGSAASFQGNSNSFDVQLGWPVANEQQWELSQGVDGSIFGPSYSPPLSPVMIANGWSNVLRMTVNKQLGSQVTQCGVNLYPTTNIFYGNYALRFDMYLSIWSYALNNFNPLSFPRQFAAFGINTRGTNCDWRLSFANGIPNGTGSNPTNADGIWYAINAGDQSLTPADFDGFASPALPNSGTSDIVSGTAVTEAGVFKRPPFPTTDGAGAGTPINQWVNVSVETHAGTNVSLYMDSAKVLSDIALTNNSTSPPNASPNVQMLSGLWTNGLPMLGYLQPYTAQSDESAFVYFSNVRVVEISPYVILAPTNSYLVFPGSNFTFTSAATYSTAPLTNGWFKGFTGTPALVQPVATTNGTNLADSLTITNVTTGNAYYSIYSDPAGSVTSFAAQVEVIIPQTNVVVAQGSNATFTVTPSGPSRTTSPFAIGYLWKTNGVSLANNTESSGVTNAALVVSNSQASDAAVTYTCLVTNIGTNLVNNLFQVNVAQSLTTPASTLTIAVPPGGVTVTPPAQTNVWGSSASFAAAAGTGTAPFGYSWKRGATALAGATKYSGTNAANLTVSNLTINDGGTYTVTVTNIAGTATGSGILTVLTPAPSFATSGSVLLSGGNVTLAFGSTNVYDKTNAFVLQSAPLVEGPYTNVTTATFTTNATGFQVTAPQASSTNMFYRLVHVP